VGKDGCRARRRGCDPRPSFKAASLHPGVPCVQKHSGTQGKENFCPGSRARMCEPRACWRWAALNIGMNDNLQAWQRAGTFSCRAMSEQGLLGLKLLCSLLFCSLFLWVSQNPRVLAWSGLAGTSGVTQPNPLLKQGHPEQAAQARVQAGHEYLQRRRHSLPGVLVLAAAGNKSAMWPPLPLLGCGGEWKETGRNWWVGIRAVEQNSKQREQEQQRYR